ncbi:MAG: Kelch repeat-containing protein [Candidatus Heimdallarchaeaceae archaeon]
MKSAKNKQKTRISFSLLIIASLLFLTIISSIQINAAIPTQRLAHAMVYDSANDRIILFGGLTTPSISTITFDTWAYDYNTNEWTQLITENSPYGAYGAKMTYDSESDKIISYGASHADHVVSNQTWTYDYTENTWTRVYPSNEPGLRSSHRMIYDSESDVVLMIAGHLQADSNPIGGEIYYNDTWAFDYNTNTWTNLTSAIYPMEISFGPGAYDSESDRVVVFGGRNRTMGDPYSDPTGEVYLQETWAFDYNTNTWENVTPSLSPDARVGANMAYDSENDLIILFGGYTHLDPTGMSDETWAFDYNTITWTQLNPDGDLERRGHKMTYDSESGKIILFGGNVGDQASIYLDETWVFDYNFNNWTLMPIPEDTDDTNSFFIPTLISLSVIVIVLLKRRKNK